MHTSDTGKDVLEAVVAEIEQLLLSDSLSDAEKLERLQAAYQVIQIARMNEPENG
jgi:hypothetical protein